jgi:predicted CXXCH cytochrome family protein
MKPAATTAIRQVQKRKSGPPVGVLIRGRFIALLPVLLVATMQMSAVERRGIEHPGSIRADDNCSSCHADKARGKSVHAVMVLPCTICHLARTQGDMTTLSLLMPKPKICSACHEQSPTLREHRPVVNGSCLDCHDAHSSNRNMLLRTPTNGPHN